MILISACLLGLRCRYDGQAKQNNRLINSFGKTKFIVPICPEQLGGLPTPRPPCSIINGDGFSVLSGTAKVVRLADNADVTEHFLKGAEEVVKIARLLGATDAFLKAKSPSCSVNFPIGVTAAALLREGIKLTEYP